jgi:hypothetical protein
MHRQISAFSFASLLAANLLCSCVTVATSHTLGPSIAAAAVEVFVSPSGSDASGCGAEPDKPCKSIQFVLANYDQVDISITLAPGASTHALTFMLHFEWLTPT